MMKVVAEADEKKRKRMMLGSAGSGSSSGAPQSTAWCPHLGVAASTTSTVELGPSPIIPTAAIPAAIATTAVQLCPYFTVVAGCH
jgi:hypothetical protein